MNQILSRFNELIAELSRRRVFRVAAAYTVIGWLVIQVTSSIFPILLLPGWLTRAVVVMVLLGCPVVLTLAWAFDITPEGLRRTAPLARAPAGAADPGAYGGTRSRRLLRWSVNREAPAHRQTTLPPPAELHPPDPERVKRASLAHLRHELRTPINAILGYSEMLMEDAPKGEAHDLLADLRRIHSAGKDLLALIDASLHPDKLSAQLLQDVPAFRTQLQHDLRTPITTVVGYAEMLIEECRDRGRDDVLPDLQRIRTAATRLLQLVNDIVQLSVGEQPGEGLGVGRISNLAEEVLAKVQTAAPEGAEGVSEGTLLIVDDSDMNRELLSMQLARQGYTVATAEHGRQALEMMETQSFDLVLLDIMMPEMDGIETLRRLKADEELRDVPIIMISALDEVASLVRCMEMGAADYLSKPFEPALLRARIGAALNARCIQARQFALLEELRDEQRWSERLLASLFPPPVAERVRAGETGFVESLPDATALCFALDGRIRGRPRVAPDDFLTLRNRLFASFDGLAQRHGLEPVRTTAHRYALVGEGSAAEPDHARSVAEMALDMVDEVQRLLDEQPDALRVRIGIHSGPLVRGVLGTTRLGYDVWGEAMETANYLEALAGAHCIQLSAATHARLRERYTFESRGVVDIPGRGQMRTYLLRGRPSARDLRAPLATPHLST